jgi:hypothetical protein
VHVERARRSFTFERRGTVHVRDGSMRTLSLIGLVVCSVAVAACDERTIARFAGSEPANGGSTTNPGSPSTLRILPNQVQMAIGTSVLLSTDAPLGFESRVRWSSLQPAVAAVTPGGLVTALAPGTATIVARYSFDTTIAATATIVVVGTVAP